jgi:Flp pilus assembly protein TadD
VSYNRAGLVLLAVAACGCGLIQREPASAVRRVAILHFDNLTNRSEAGWVGAVTAAVASLDLAKAPDQFTFQAGSTNEGLLNRPTVWVRGSFDGQPGAWRLHAIEQDVRTGQTREQWQLSGADPVELGDALAKKIWRQSPNLASVDGALASAVKTGDQNKALQAVGAKLTEKIPAERAAEVARERPADANVLALAGRWALVRRNFGEAGQWFNRALRVDPENGPLLNEAAYADFFAGNVDGAMKAIARYEQIDPSDANPLDSRGEILLMSGRFREAEESFVGSYSRDPQFIGSVALRKAAVARRFSGDQPGADGLFQRYLDAVGKNGPLVLLQAQWDYESGREKQAIDRLKDVNSTLALAQLAIWTRDTAAAAKAQSLAKNDPERVQAELARLVASNGPAPQGEAGALVLVLRHDFAAAVGPLRQAVQSRLPAEATQWQVLLAWALAESGHAGEAKPLLKNWPLPGSAESLWESMPMRKFGELRAKVK